MVKGEQWDYCSWSEILNQSFYILRSKIIYLISLQALLRASINDNRGLLNWCYCFIWNISYVQWCLNVCEPLWIFNSSLFPTQVLKLDKTPLNRNFILVHLFESKLHICEGKIRASRIITSFEEKIRAGISIRCECGKSSPYFKNKILDIRYQNLIFTT